MTNATIPDDFLDLFQKKAFAHLATLMKSGAPQLTPVWIDYDGECLLVNSRIGRLKNKNMRARPQVAIEIVDPENPYRYLSVRGTVAEIVYAEDTSHIDALAQRYLEIEKYPWAVEGEEREIFRIKPERVVARTIG